MVHRAYILLGSNLNDRHAQIQAAERFIQAGAGKIIQQSSLYETAPWGKTDQPDFLNKILAIETAHTPMELLDKLLEIELKMGRERKERWDARLIDIDILFYDDLVYSDARLVIPHPGIAHRKFTLVPLIEIIPDFIHPVFNKNLRELLTNCEDPGTVTRLSDTRYE